MKNHIPYLVFLVLLVGILSGVYQIYPSSPTLTFAGVGEEAADDDDDDNAAESEEITSCTINSIVGTVTRGENQAPRAYTVSIEMPGTTEFYYSTQFKPGYDVFFAVDLGDGLKYTFDPDSTTPPFRFFITKGKDNPSAADIVLNSLPVKVFSQLPIALAGNQASGYYFDPSVNLCKFVVSKGAEGREAHTLQFNYTNKSSFNLMIPAMHHKLTIQGEYNDPKYALVRNQSVELIVEGLPKTSSGPTIATTFELKSDTETTLILWEMPIGTDKEGVRLYFRFEKDEDRYFLPAKENDEKKDTFLSTYLEDDGSRRYRLKEELWNKDFEKPLLLELDPPEKVQPLQGYLFRNPEGGLPEGKITFETLIAKDEDEDETPNLFRFSKEDDLKGYRIVHLINNPRVASANLIFSEKDGSYFFSPSPHLPFNSTAQHQLAIIDSPSPNTTDSSCLNVVRAGVVKFDQDWKKSTIYFKDNTPHIFTLLNEHKASIQSEDARIILLVDPDSTNSGCLSDRMEGTAGKDGGVPGTLQTPETGSGATSAAFPTNWCTTSHTNPNKMGMHILTEGGNLPDDIKPACPVVGSWGYIKGLWYKPEDTANAIRFVNEAHNTNMIPVLRLATRWNGAGMVSPLEYFGVGSAAEAAGRVAPLIENIASGRTNKNLPILFQIFNEPNWATEWVTNDEKKLPAQQRAQEYAQFMVALKKALPENHTSQKYFLVTSGLNPVPGEETHGALEFIAMMKEEDGFMDSFDIWGSQAKLSDNAGGGAVDPSGLDCTNYSGDNGLHPCFYSAELKALGTRSRQGGEACPIASGIPVFLLEAGYTANVANRAEWTTSALGLWRADPRVLGATFWILRDPHGRYDRSKWMGEPVFETMKTHLNSLGMGNPACGGTYTGTPGTGAADPTEAKALATNVLETAKTLFDELVTVLNSLRSIEGIPEALAQQLDNFTNLATDFLETKNIVEQLGQLPNLMNQFLALTEQLGSTELPGNLPSELTNAIDKLKKLTENIKQLNTSLGAFSFDLSRLLNGSVNSDLLAKGIAITNPNNANQTISFPLAGVDPGKRFSAFNDPRIVEVAHRATNDSIIPAELLLTILIIENYSTDNLNLDKTYKCHSVTDACGIGQIIRKPRDPPYDWRINIAPRIAASAERTKLRQNPPVDIMNNIDHIFGMRYFIEDRAKECNLNWTKPWMVNCVPPFGQGNPLTLEEVAYAGYRFYGACKTTYTRVFGKTQYHGTYCQLAQTFYCLMKSNQPEGCSNIVNKTRLNSNLQHASIDPESLYCPHYTSTVLPPPPPSLASWLPSAYADTTQATEVFVWHDANANQVAEPDEARLSDQQVSIWAVEDWHYDADTQQYRCSTYDQPALWEGTTDEAGRVRVSLDHTGLVDVGVRKIADNDFFTGFSGPVSEVGRRNAWIQMTCGDWHIIRLQDFAQLGMSGALSYGVVPLREPSDEPSPGDYPYRVLQKPVTYYTRPEENRGYGELFLQPYEDNSYVVYELAQMINGQTHLSFDYQYETESGEGAPLEFVVIASNNHDSQVLYDGGLLQDNTPWQSALVQNAQAGLFDSEGKIDLTPFSGQYLRIRFAARLTEKTNLNTNYALANAMKIREITLHGKTLDTAVGHYPLNQRDTKVIGFWEQDTSRAFLTTNPAQNDENLVIRLLNWIHPRIGYANENGYLVQGEIFPFSQLLLCENTLESGVAMTPVSALEPSRLDLSYVDGPSALRTMRFKVAPDCASQPEQNVLLNLQLQVLDEDNAIDPERSIILASFDNLSGLESFEVDLTSYLGERIIISLIAEAKPGTSPFEKFNPVFVGEIELIHEDFVKIASASLPLASMVILFLPILLLVGGVGGIYLVFNIAKSNTSNSSDRSSKL